MNFFFLFCTCSSLYLATWDHFLNKPFALNSCLRVCFWELTLRYDLKSYRVLGILISKCSLFWLLSFFFLPEQFRNEKFCWLSLKKYFLLSDSRLLPAFGKLKNDCTKGPTITQDKLPLNILLPHHISALGKCQNGRDNIHDFWNSEADIVIL